MSTKFTKIIKFGDRSRVFIIAEAGINHNGSLKSACKMVDIAKDAGADAVKFQNYRTEDFIADTGLKYTYKSRGRVVTEPMWQLCKRCEMKEGWLGALKTMCDKRGIVFMSTPTSKSGVDDLVGIGVRMIKNGSDYLSHLPLLKYMGGTGLPVIISTGMAHEREISDAVKAVLKGGRSPIILMHCTSLYPTKPQDVNLRRMVALKERFSVPVGFSDHTIGSSAAIQAVSLGASVIEKHFTVSHDLRGPDHWFSLEPAELKRYVKDIRDAEDRMGEGAIRPGKAEDVSRREFTLSLVSVRDLAAGHALKKSDFIIAKPGTGIPPKDASAMVGRKLARRVKKGSVLKKGYFK